MVHVSRDVDQPEHEERSDISAYTVSGKRAAGKVPRTGSPKSGMDFDRVRTDLEGRGVWIHKPVGAELEGRAIALLVAGDLAAHAVKARGGEQRIA